MGRLKIVYPVCCGMDVHRDFLIACIAATNAQGVTEYQSRRFSTYTGSLRELRDWLLANDCKDVCMESTGKYWFPVHNILEESCHVVVSHPKFVKAPWSWASISAGWSGPSSWTRPLTCRAFCSAWAAPAAGASPRK